MSAIQFVARFTVSNGATPAEPAFNLFATGAEVTAGSLSLHRAIRVDRLDARGIDGIRTRRRHRQFEDLVILLTEPLPVGKTFGDRESDYMRAVGRVGSFSIRINGKTLIWSKCVAEIDIAPTSRLPSALIGFGSVINSIGTLQTQWTIMRLVEGSAS